MNKVIILSLITTGLLADTFINPLPNSVKSIDNGGTLQAIDAYKDGIGAELIDKPGVATDNSAMNSLAIKYGEAAKANNVTIVDQVVYGTGTAADKIIAGKLTINGATCNDGNVNSIGETWLNGLCQGGTMVNGTTCNDNNVQTINDIYTNNICAGTNVEGQTCTDNNAQTINDKYVNGVCVGTSAPNGSSCNDNNVQTINDIYTNGVCAGTNVQGTSCNDNNAQTINDIYTNGICAGTNVENQSCNDNLANTYADKYTNGVCVGTNATSCKDIKNITGTTTSGNYIIDTDGNGAIAPFTAYCDMTTDGGGWTALNQTSGTLYTAAMAETSCQAKGLVLFIPRTDNHFRAMRNIYGTAPFTLMGIYPKVKGATCIGVSFNSGTCGNWGPHYGSRWFVQGTFTYSEPNGDNDIDGSMRYVYSGLEVASYNDIFNSNAGGYTTNTWVCSHPSEN